MRTHDTRRMLQMAHQKFDETGLPQWKHSEKWLHYCEVCKSKKQLEESVNYITNT